MKKLLLSLSLLAASCAFTAPPADFSAIKNLYHQGNAGCVASVVNAAKAYYVTAKHCWTQTEGDLGLKHTKLSLVAAADGVDLVLLQGGVAREELKLARTPPRPNEEVIVVGYAGETPELKYRLFVISPSVVLEPETTLLPDAIYQGEVLGGTSGSPILNKRNEIVGIVSGVYRRVGGVTWGATLDQLHEFLHQYLPTHEE